MDRNRDSHMSGQLRTLPVQVRCYAGYRHAERPCSFTHDGHEVAVWTISERWRTPDHPYFRVEGDDGVSYLLRHAETTDDWEVLQ